MYTQCTYMYVVLTSEDGDGGGLASSIVSQESSDLTLIHVETQLIHSHFPLTLLLLVTGQQLGQYVLLCKHHDQN